MLRPDLCVTKYHRAVNFVDFEKAFDSVHRESLWKLMRLPVYGLPSKIIDVIRILHDGFRCSVVVNNGQTDWFPSDIRTETGMYVVSTALSGGY